MEINSIDICEILGFKVTCFILTDQDEIKSTYYVICNSTGEVVSRRYKAVSEPMEVLRKIESLAVMQH